MKELHVGFTGTAKGCTTAQRDALARVLVSFDFTHFHHGDCIGSDAEAHLYVRDSLKHVIIHVHPPVKEDKRAFCKGGHFYHDPADYLVRDEHIAEAADILIATPETAEEQLRSGTWATIRRARKRRIPIIRVNPDGSIGIG